MIKTWEDIPGWFDFQDIYDQAVAEAKGLDMLVEVGSFLGKSTAYMAKRIEEIDKNLILYAVDSWDDSEYSNWWNGVVGDPPSPWPCPVVCGYPLRKAFDFCKRAVGYGCWTIQMRSVDAAKTFKNGSCSFVFIDANHLYDGVSADIKAWSPKVRPGGILAGHDYGMPDRWPDVTRAVDEAFGSRVEHRGNSWLVRM